MLKIRRYSLIAQKPLFSGLINLWLPYALGIWGSVQETFVQCAVLSYSNISHAADSLQCYIYRALTPLAPPQCHFSNAALLKGAVSDPRVRSSIADALLMLSPQGDPKPPCEGSETSLSC